MYLVELDDSAGPSCSQLPDHPVVLCVHGGDKHFWRTSVFEGPWCPWWILASEVDSMSLVDLCVPSLPVVLSNTGFFWGAPSLLNPSVHGGSLCPWWI